jgi:hypothetical protein
MDTKENLAGSFYTIYCQEVGGKAFNGDPLPTWEEFSKDPNKQKQANGWRAVAESALIATQMLHQMTP